jgi:Ca2+/Na+ antiporter
MFKKNLLERRIALFVISMICYKYADRAISYLVHKSVGSLNAEAIAIWVGLVLLGLLPFVYGILLMRKLGYRQWWPLPILAASVAGSFVMLWQGHVDSRIAFAVYFVPFLILIFVKKRSDNTPTEAGTNPKSLGARAS